MKKSKYVCYDSKKHIVMRATLEIDLKYKDEDHPVFTVSGDVKKRNQWICGGQCLDTMIVMFPPLLGNERFAFWYKMWKVHHLNDLHAGTKEQEKVLKEAVENGIIPGYGANYYTESCEYLKSIDLYEVEYDGKPYRYGHGWIYYEIPEEDLNKIKETMSSETDEWIKVKEVKE